MNEVLFEVLKAVVILFVILVARYGIPFLKEKLEDTKYSWVVKWVGIAVRSAEQTILGNKTGAEKKAIVVDFIRTLLIKKNIAISEEQLNTLIESAVFELNKEKTEWR